ncbi:uncharacterized protein LOC135366043 [Ornithodoros turicata]|uniref:uncharacterized protein LOC135366043 n=1 Tax=Ornithodoros turicata TaxID=34597 RepID=UPI0031386C08
MASSFCLVFCIALLHGRVEAVLDLAGHLYLTVSSLEKPVHRALEINWYSLPQGIRRDAVIKLYSRDDAQSPWSVLETHHISTENGTFRTNWSFPLVNFAPDKINGSDDCIKYKVSLIRHSLHDDEIAMTCIRGRATWIRDHCSSLSSFKLYEIMLPASHKSGNYDILKADVVVPVENVVDYQEENILDQLVYGIRFLDIRVRLYNSDFWVNRDDIRGPITIRELLRTVKSFVKMTGEIVVVDFHRFIFDDDNVMRDHRRHHLQLEKLILEELEGVIAHKHAATTPIGELTNNCNADWPGTVVVSYNEDSIRSTSEYFLPGSNHLWGGARDAQHLERYLQDRICLYTQGVQTVAMASLHALFPYRTKTNRQLAQEVNGAVTQWFRDKWWQCANVVATDFFLGNDMIDVAINSNVRRSKRVH